MHIIQLYNIHKISKGMWVEGCCSGFDFALCLNIFFYVELKINND